MFFRAGALVLMLYRMYRRLPAGQRRRLRGVAARHETNYLRDVTLLYELSSFLPKLIVAAVTLSTAVRRLPRITAGGDYAAGELDSR